MAFIWGKKVNHYDPYILSFLFENKEVSLAKIGRLFLNENTSPPSTQFEYNKKAATTTELIDYITGKTGKKRVLIESDLDSYFELICQFINIGKPWEIQGVGTVKKMNTSSEYIFIPHDPFSKKEEKKPSQPRRKISAPGNAAKRSSRSAVMLLALLVIAIIAGVIGWGTYQLFFTQKNNTEPAKDSTTMQTLPQIVDSALNSNPQQADTSATLSQLKETDTAEFKFIYEITKSQARAITRTEMMKSFKYNSTYDSLNTDSGKVYRLYIPAKIPAKDTLRLKDSLVKNFHRPITIVRTP